MQQADLTLITATAPQHFTQLLQIVSHLIGHLHATDHTSCARIVDKLHSKLLSSRTPGVVLRTRQNTGQFSQGIQLAQLVLFVHAKNVLAKLIVALGMIF